MKKPATSDPKKRKGLIIVNTGDGKGKSTASFGLALRAAGNKMNVFIMQFMKGPWKAGERKALKALSEYIEYEAMGDGFTWDTKNPEQDKKTARNAFDIAKEKPVQQRLSNLLLRALYEHDQNLKKEVGKWADKWDAFKKKQANKTARDADEKTSEAHDDLKKAAVFIRDLVDKMTLYGRPSGDCFLCRASGS